MTRKTNRHQSPYITFSAIGLVGSLLIGYYLYRWGGGLLMSYLVSVNIITLLFYGYDKIGARRSMPRVPEGVLQGLAIVGGSPAALVSQKLFRHKTLKKSFQLFYWLIVLVQLVLLIIFLFSH